MRSQKLFNLGCAISWECWMCCLDCWSRRLSCIDFSVFDCKGLAKWIIGGFAIGIVEDEIKCDGRCYPFYGLAELLM